MPYTPKPKNKVVDDRENSGDHPDHTLGNLVAQANIQPSQNLGSMGGWPSPR